VVDVNRTLNPVIALFAGISAVWVLGIIISFHKPSVDDARVVICVIGLIATWLIGTSLLSRKRRGMYPAKDD